MIFDVEKQNRQVENKNKSRPGIYKHYHNPLYALKYLQEIKKDPLDLQK